MADAGTLTLDPPSVTVTEAPPAPRAAPSSRGSRAVLTAAALIIAGGAALRFAALHTSIWFDESVTVRDVSGSFGQMLHKVVNHEASPPFYFICLWIWRHLVGSTVFDLRLLSWVAGTATIALAFYVARPRIGDRGALILAACVAVSPALVYYSAEMRMYGLLILVSAIGFAAFLRASDSPTTRSLSVWAIASILAIGTQYYAAVAIAPQAALLLAQGWRANRTRPQSLGVGVLPKGLRLTRIIRGSTYLLERFVAATPVAVRVHGPGSAFTPTYWRFLVEPAGAHVGSP